MKLPHRGTVTLFGLVVAVWFACLEKGAHDLWAVTLLCAWLSVFTILQLRASFKHRDPLNLPLIPSFVMMIFGFLISSHFSYDMNTTRLELSIWFVIGMAYFLCVNSFRDQTLRFLFLKYSGLAIIPIMLLALAQYLQTSSFILFSHWSAASTFTNSAVLAGFAISWTIIFWHFRQQNRLFYGLFAACLVTLLLAKSWWSMISLLVGFVFYYKEEIKRTLSLKPWSVMGFGLLGTGVLILSTYLKFGVAPESFKSVYDRWGWWITGLRMMQHHPLTGVGLGSYATAFPFFKSTTMLNSLYAHSFPIQLLSETGLWGTGGGLLVAFVYARLIHRQKPKNAEFAAYRAAVITIFCFSLTTIYLEYFIGKLLLFMAMALSLSALDLKPIPLTKSFLNLSEIGFLALVPVWYLPFLASQDHVRGVQYAEKGDRSQAEDCLQKGIRLNPYQDESYAALARIYRASYERTHSQSDLSEWRFYIRQALDYKKDTHYLVDLTLSKR